MASASQNAPVVVRVTPSPAKAERFVVAAGLPMPKVMWFCGSASLLVAVSRTYLVGCAQKDCAGGAELQEQMENPVSTGASAAATATRFLRTRGTCE
jgi:hypothetical protein